MISYEIFLKSIVDIKNFVNVVNTYDFDIDLESGRYTIDAKSIMGIFSLDLSKPINMHVHSDDAEKIEAVIRINPKKTIRLFISFFFIKKSPYFLSTQISMSVSPRFA